MDQKHGTAHGSSLRPRESDTPEFDLRDWDLKARRVGHQNTNSRRFSASNVTGLREDACRSSRSNNITISSTASSPGYPLKGEIDPLTYSFTTALKALQAKSGHGNWDCLSSEGFALNSKWNDAEKYICNPHSGQVPVECLSARSFSNLQSRTTMSGPLVYSPKTRTAQPKPSLAARKSLFQIPIEEKKVVGMTRDVGIQSTEADINDSSSSSNSSPSPTSTPSIGERMSKRFGIEGGESPNSSSKPKSEEEVHEMAMVSAIQVAQKDNLRSFNDHMLEVLEVVEIKGGEEDRGVGGDEESSKGDRDINGYSDIKRGSPLIDEEEDMDQERRCKQSSAGGVGCLSWMRSRRSSRQHSRRQRVDNLAVGPDRIKRPNLFISCTRRRD